MCDPSTVPITYQQSKINLHSFVWVRFNGLVEAEDRQNFKEFKFKNSIIKVSNNIQIKKNLIDDSSIKYIRTTPGRILLNETFY